MDPTRKSWRDKAVRLAARQVSESIRVKERLPRSSLVKLAALTDATATALKAGRGVFLFGNGGSAADAQHIAAELQGRLRKRRPSLRAMALTTNASILTAVGNDFGFLRTFSRQIEGLAQPGDIVLGITTSGTSANILHGLQAARRVRAITAAFTGSYTKRIASLADHLLAVPSKDTQRIQEVHVLLGHIYCDLLERSLFESK